MKIEKGISIGIIAVITLATVIAIGFGIGYSIFSQLYYNLRSLNAVDSEEVGVHRLHVASQLFICYIGFFATAVFLQLCVVLVSLFLVTSSMVGIVVLRKRKASQDNVNGLIRFLVISVVVLVCFAMRSSVALLELNFYSMPAWYVYGIVQLVCGTATFLAFLCFVWFSVQRQRHQICPRRRP